MIGKLLLLQGMAIIIFGCKSELKLCRKSVDATELARDLTTTILTRVAMGIDSAGKVKSLDSERN